MDVIPLEKFRLVQPDYLSGAAGENRVDDRSQLMIHAGTDIEAIECWLGEFKDSPNTCLNYRKEAERLLLWTNIERKIALSDISKQDMALFEAFLQNPKENWIGDPVKRTSARWRPFSKALSDSSTRQALVILKSMFAFLVDVRYLKSSPISLQRRKAIEVTAARQRSHKPTEVRLLVPVDYFDIGDSVGGKRIKRLGEPAFLPEHERVMQYAYF